LPGLRDRLDALEDLAAGRRLRLEVALHHRFQLLQRLEDREVQIGTEVGGEDQPTVAVDDEGPHDLPAHALAAGTRVRWSSSARLRTVWIITFASSPDKESAGPSVVSSHLSGRANTSACGEPVRGGVEVAGNAPAATTAP
jgi:hypothetical protein